MRDRVGDVAQVLIGFLVPISGYWNSYRYDPAISGVVRTLPIVCDLLLSSLC